MSFLKWEKGRASEQEKETPAPRGGGSWASGPGRAAGSRHVGYRGSWWVGGENKR